MSTDESIQKLRQQLLEEAYSRLRLEITKDLRRELRERVEAELRDALRPIIVEQIRKESKAELLSDPDLREEVVLELANDIRKNPNHDIMKAAEKEVFTSEKQRLEEDDEFFGIIVEEMKNQHRMEVIEKLREELRPHVKAEILEALQYSMKKDPAIRNDVRSIVVSDIIRELTK